jgi:hypothetical protein
LSPPLTLGKGRRADRPWRGYRREAPLEDAETALGSRFLIADLARKYAFIFAAANPATADS